MLVFLLLSHLSLSGAVQSGIFGGREAKPHSRPYMASLQSGGHHTCGGVLIREDYVLTAAHCLKYRAQVVVLGAHNISEQEKSQQKINISKHIPHPKYPHKELPPTDPRTHQHDVMLLKLDSKAKMTKYVRVLELPKNYRRMKAGVQCEVAGWGKRVLGRGAESVLYEAEVKLAANSKDCKKIQDAYFNEDQMACSFSKGKEGFCQGDSGGPLICQHKNRHVLYGVIASTGFPCDTPDYPQVCTRVPYFLPWIKEVLHGKDNVTVETGDVWNV